jgi:hypothetical protein
VHEDGALAAQQINHPGIVDTSLSGSQVSKRLRLKVAVGDMKPQTASTHRQAIGRRRLKQRRGQALPAAGVREEKVIENEYMLERDGRIDRVELGKAHPMTSHTSEKKNRLATVDSSAQELLTAFQISGAPQKLAVLIKQKRDSRQIIKNELLNTD